MPTKSGMSAKREVYISKIWKPFYMYFIYIYSIHVVVCLLISWLNVAKNATKDKWNTFTICNYTAPKTLISFQHAKHCLKKSVSSVLGSCRMWMTRKRYMALFIVWNRDAITTLAGVQSLWLYFTDVSDSKKTYS